MLSYLHSFHAGNHADILKHVTLLYCLEYFSKKQKPFTVFDTHSGRGLYNLFDDSAVKTHEAEQGIQKLLLAMDSAPGSVPPQFASYTDFVRQSLKKGFYPGSPAIERCHIAEKSALFLTELHKTEYDALCKNMNLLSQKPAATVTINNKDGFAFLKAATPPVIKRGLILCDSSYEEPSDYENVAKTLCAVHKKWCGATIILWYPLLSHRAEEIDGMKQQILCTAKNQNANTEVLDATLCVDRSDSHTETDLHAAIGSDSPRLYGSGVLVVNPCWNLDAHLAAVLPYAAHILGRNGNGSHSVQFL